MRTFFVARTRFNDEFFYYACDESENFVEQVDNFRSWRQVITGDKSDFSVKCNDGKTRSFSDAVVALASGEINEFGLDYVNRVNAVVVSYLTSNI